MKRHHHLTVSLPKCPQWAGLSRAEVKDQKFHPGIPFGWQGPKYLAGYLQPPGVHISRELESEAELKPEPKTQIWDAGFSNQILTATITSCICFLGWVILWCPPDQVRNTLKPGKALLVPVRVLPGKISMQELTVLGGKTWLPYGWASSMARYLKKQNGTAIWTLSTEAS